jgi:ABC-type polysaccharide/polyol phosphate export permease
MESISYPLAFVRSRSRYLDLILLLVKRELTVKYRGSILGYIWSMLNPLLFMAIVSVVFSFVVKGIPDYNLYILSGILFWNFVSLSLNLGTSSIVRNAPLLLKVKIPIWVLPLVPVLFALSNMALSLIPYALLYGFQGRAIPSQLWLVPVVLFFTLLFISGLATLLAVINVFFRDVAHVLDPLITLLFYATPILYKRNSPEIPENVSQLLLLNPMTHYIEAFRATVFGQETITLVGFGFLVGFAAAVWLVALYVYKRNKLKIVFNL